MRDFNAEVEILVIMAREGRRPVHGTGKDEVKTTTVRIKPPELQMKMLRDALVANERTKQELALVFAMILRGEGHEKGQLVQITEEGEVVAVVAVKSGATGPT